MGSVPSYTVGGVVGLTIAPTGGVVLPLVVPEAEPLVLLLLVLLVLELVDPDGLKMPRLPSRPSGRIRLMVVLPAK